MVDLTRKKTISVTTQSPMKIKKTIRYISKQYNKRVKKENACTPLNRTKYSMPGIMENYYVKFIT